MTDTMSAKEMRTNLPQIVRRVRQGASFTVLYRSRPAFRIVPVTPLSEVEEVCEEDSLYHAPAVGRSTDGRVARDHDKILYR